MFFLARAGRVLLSATRWAVLQQRNVVGARADQLWQPDDGVFFERAYAQLQSGDPVADKAAGADHDAIVDELVYRLGLGLNAWRQSNLAVSESETITVDALRCLFQRNWLLPISTAEDQVFMHPFGNAMMLSLHSDETVFAELTEVLAAPGENQSTVVAPERVHMSQVLAMLPAMSAEACAEKGMPASMAVEAVYLNPTRASPETHMCCFHSNSLRLLQHIGGHFELESAVLILAKAAVEASASGTSKYAAMVPDALAKLEESTLFIATTAKGEPLLEAPLGAGVDSVNGWLAEEANGGGGVVAFTSPSRAHKAISCASNEARERWGQCRLSAVKGGEFLRGIIEGGASPVVVFDVYKDKELQEVQQVAHTGGCMVLRITKELLNGGSNSDGSSS